MNFDPSLPTSYEYIHYTSENLNTLDLSRIYSQTTQKWAFHRPNGLWLSIAGINDWEHYCLKNNYNLHNLKYEFQIKLKPHANILILYNASAYADFERKYAYYPEGTEIHEKNYTLSLSIRWENIINDYQGIALPHVIPKLYNSGLWYETWSCTSACIWDLQIVSRIEKMVIMK